MFRREELLIGDKITNIHNAKIIVFGIGGVGGYAVEMLVRSGILNITLVDFDVVDVSNKNRQIIATDSTIGKFKVLAMKERILDINPDCNVTVINKKLTNDNINDFNLLEYDYIIDAIDMITSKISLIKFAHDNNISIISSMGVGNRYEIPNFEIVDINKTYNDGLAKVLRKKLRENGVNKHNVVFCKNESKPNGETIGSIAYYPAIAGTLLASFVINDLINKE